MIDTSGTADGLFTCPHHLGELRITPTTCAGMWARARRCHEDALIRLAACVGCQIGAAHAGVPTSTSPAASSGLACARCGATGRRLIGRIHCVACYNRQREYVAGRTPAAAHRPVIGRCSAP